MTHCNCNYSLLIVSRPGAEFNTNIVMGQRDCLSPIQCTLYLGNTFKFFFKTEKLPRVGQRMVNHCYSLLATRSLLGTQMTQDQNTKMNYKLSWERKLPWFSTTSDGQLLPQTTRNGPIAYCRQYMLEPQQKDVRKKFGNIIIMIYEAKMEENIAKKEGRQERTRWKYLGTLINTGRCQEQDEKRKRCYGEDQAHIRRISNKHSSQTKKIQICGQYISLQQWNFAISKTTRLKSFKNR